MRVRNADVGAFSWSGKTKARFDRIVLWAIIKISDESEF
jgi:hypothetical protein